MFPSADEKRGVAAPSTGMPLPHCESEVSANHRSLNNKSLNACEAVEIQPNLGKCKGGVRGGGNTRLKILRLCTHKIGLKNVLVLAATYHK